MNKITDLIRITGICLIAFTVLIISCTSEMSQDDLVKSNIEIYMQENLNDPESYEFVELTLIDSVLINDNIEYRIEYFNDRISFTESQIESRQNQIEERYLGSYLYSESQRDRFKSDIEDYHSDIENIKKVLAGIDSIKVELGDEIYNVASYTYSFHYRANNEFGALVLNEHIIQTDPAPDFQVINLADNQDKVLLNPNQFPGYIELVERILYPDRNEQN